MRKKILHKVVALLSILVIAPAISFAQVDIIAVGSKAFGQEYIDSILVGKLSEYVNVTYVDQKNFNNHLINGDSLIYENYAGVVFFESCSSGALPNFAIDEFPIPSVTMEAGFLLKWGLLDETSGGIWPYITPEAIDLQWKIVDSEHKITFWAGDGKYENDEIITWSENPNPSIYGIPYIHNIAEYVEILAVAAREDGAYEDGSFDDASCEYFDQDEAITLCILPDKEILYLCASMYQLGKNDTLFATEDFFNILKNSVLFMFDELDEPVGVKDFTNRKLAVDVYPNPAHNLLNVKVNTKEGSRISLYTLAGQKIITVEKTAMNRETNVQLNLASVSKGMYMLKVESGNNKSYSKVLIK